MTRDIFPEGQAIFKDKPYSNEFFTLTVDEIDGAGESFIGMIRVDETDASYFLFFLRGDAYASGCIMYGKPMPLSIKDFLQHMSKDIKQRALSLFKIDPVLLKGMLVFFQKEPSIKKTMSAINLTDFLGQIKTKEISTIVIFKKSNTYNFFYFHRGEPKVAHIADPQKILEDIDSITKHLLLIFAKGIFVETMIYHDIKTSEAVDTAEIKSFLKIDDLLNKESTKSIPAVMPSIEFHGKAKRIRIEITDGIQKGNKFNIPLPCTIGRRDADIRIRDMAISKRHASLEALGEKIIFKDLNSTNGSMVNNKIVRETELSDGDIVQMGNTTLKIHLVSN